MRHYIVIVILGMVVAAMVIRTHLLTRPPEGSLEPMTAVDSSLPCTNPPQRGLMPKEYTCDGP